ncbi:MAG: hypothetical protein AUH89_01805 [Ktedonobacter sp. 13_1_40CM_4_52_4]|nr:MAG: hypothetical protein AUH89_01805 [Ktedonobacter sp. 13_1_40CM_4_52_4]
MTIISLADCCRRLSIDPKTFRRWLALHELTVQPHPADARIKGVTRDQLLLVATAHRRTLPSLPEVLPVLAPTGKPEPPPPLPRETIDLLQALTDLPAQIAALQQHLAVLTQQVHLPPATTSHSQDIAGAVAEPVLARPVMASPTPAKAAAKSRQLASLATDRPRQPVHVLPLVEYGTHGDYVVICPTQGLLSLQPDSPEWFTWLGTLSSFRFVGKFGRLTVHRESQRWPRAAWRAHRQIRNHSYNHRLGPTECLTIAVLEQAAAALQSHLK